MTVPNDLDADVLDVLETDGLTAREAATRLTDKTTGAAMDTEGPGEFWCPACGSRCTRSQNHGTEYGHLLDCPERDLPDPREMDGAPGSRFTPNKREKVTSSTLERALAATPSEDA